MSLRTCLTPAGGTGAFRMQHSRRFCLHLCMRDAEFMDRGGTLGCMHASYVDSQRAMSLVSLAPNP